MSDVAAAADAGPQAKLDRVDRLYQILSGDDDVERACAAIPDEACTHLPRNYVINLINGTFGKLAQQIGSPGLVLPWLMSGVGAPAGLVGLLVPVKQSAAWVPQIAFAAQVRRRAVRKWLWVGAGVIKAVSLLLMIVAALIAPPVVAGVAIVVLLGVFSVAGGVGSIAFQDVLGKTIPKGKRGRLLSYRATIAGGLTLIVGFVFWLYVEPSGAVIAPLVLLTLAAVCWIGAAIAFGIIEEAPGANEGGRNLVGEVAAGWRLVRNVGGYRRFLVARVLLIAVEVATPFYALHASESFGGMLGALGTYIFAIGFANLVASPLWGRVVDRSSRGVMVVSALLSAGVGGIALALGAFSEPWAGYTYMAVFFGAGVAEAGLNVGRKTYLVDGAPEDERPLYVAFTNTTVGAFTLAAAALGIVAQAYGAEAAIAALIAIALVAALAARAMPSADGLSGD